MKQILICVYGEIEVILDNGRGDKESLILKDPSVGLYVGPSTWRIIRWLKSDSVLLVLASHHYDPSDYIHDYDQFKVWVNKENQ